MTLDRRRFALALWACVAVLSIPVQAQEVNIARSAAVSASSYRDDNVPSNIKDGIVSDASRWLAAEDDRKPWIEFAFPEPVTVREQKSAAVLYRGVFNGGGGDFTAFGPADSDVRYVIDLRGGEREPNTSNPFLVRTNLHPEQYWQTATDFLNDVRSVTGTHPSAYGGGGVTAPITMPSFRRW